MNHDPCTKTVSRRHIRCSHLIFCVWIFAVLVIWFVALTPQKGFAQSSFESGLIFTGVTKAFQDVTISSEVPGTVNLIKICKGEKVTKGQILLHLSSRLEKLEVKRRKMIWKDQAKLQTMQNQSAILKNMYQSTLDLYTRTDAVSREELENQHLDYERVKGQLEQTLVSEQREKIEYEIAKERLEQKRLRSPINGVVTTLFIEEGEYCDPKKPALRIVNIDKCLFLCSIDEKYISELQQGQKIKFQVQAGSTWMKKLGTLQVIHPVADPASGLVEITIHFDNADHAIHPGMPARIALPIQGSSI